MIRNLARRWSSGTRAALQTRADFSYAGARFRIDRGVINPTTFRASFLFVDFCLSRAPSRPSMILEMGCGCGLASVALAMEGHRVVALDRSLRAAKCARENARRNGCDVQVVTSDWASALRSRHRIFDRVLINPPFLLSRPSRFERELWAGEQGGRLKDALRAAGEVVADDGEIVLITSERTPRPWVLESGLDLRHSEKRRDWLEDYHLDVLMRTESQR